jgi:hypothetical protein
LGYDPLKRVAAARLAAIRTRFLGVPPPLTFSKTCGITVLAKNPLQNTFFKELRN